MISVLFYFTGCAMLAIVTFIISFVSIKKGKEKKKYLTMAAIVNVLYVLSVLSSLISIKIEPSDEKVLFLYGLYLGFYISLFQMFYCSKNRMKAKSGVTYDDFEDLKVRYHRKYSVNPESPVLDVYRKDISHQIRCLPRIYYFNNEQGQPVIKNGYLEISSSEQIAESMLGYLKSSAIPNAMMMTYENTSPQEMNAFLESFSQYGAVGYRVDNGYSPVKIQFERKTSPTLQAEQTASDFSNYEEFYRIDTSQKHDDSSDTQA